MLVAGGRAKPLPRSRTSMRTLSGSVSIADVNVVVFPRPAWRIFLFVLV
jgi:hypothetical protein